MPATLSRRQALGLGVLGAVSCAVTLSSCVPSVTPSPTTTRWPSFSRPELPQPPVVRSKEGLLTTRLNARADVLGIGVERDITTVTYDGRIPGPTWDFRPGDRLKVELVNDLPVIPDYNHTHNDFGTDLTRPHEWTTTNLHTHGLHVSPRGNQDNVFVSVRPGKKFDFDFRIPEDHQAGFFWYHPHRHGAVTQQVRGGMAGGMIVRGDLDEVPEIAAAEEKVLVIQAIELGPDYKLMPPIPDPSKSEAFYPRTQIFWTINGVFRPTITMYPGEVQRWRIVNAAEGKLASLRLAGHKLAAIAHDGMTLAEPEPADDTFLGPGNRVEVLVKAGSAGLYDLALSPGSSQKPFLPGMPQTTQPPGPSGTVSPELVPRLLATIEVRGEGPEMSLPEALPVFDPEILPIVRTREVAYTVNRRGDGSFVSFGVNGHPYDPARAPYRMKLGTAEEWTVINGADEGFVHVFHIHVNPFKVTKINGVPLEKPLWRDTFTLGPRLGDSFTFESNFTDFTGQFVQHCHVLSHEDLGMMEALEIVA